MARKKKKYGLGKLEGTLIHLEAKRKRVTEELKKRGVLLPLDATHQDTINAAYIKLHQSRKCGTTDSLNRFFSHYDKVLRDFNVNEKRVGLSRKAESRFAKKKNKAKKSSFEDQKWKFYESYEWRKLRYIVLGRDGRRCALCGATSKTGAVLHVDHIKPLKTHWHLRLDASNLQILCSLCNHGKGNWDQTDWRPKEKAA